MSGKKGLDLTRGSIPKILMRLSTPIVLSMLMFTLYLVADLYFVSRLGPDAVAAVSISGNAFFFLLGLSIVLGTGGMTLIAQRVGAGDREGANRVFQQVLVATVWTGVGICMIGLVIAVPYIRFFGGVDRSLTWGVEYFRIYAVSFPLVLMLHVLAPCFRGVGNTRTPMLITLQSLILNVILDPLLIFGIWGIPGLGVKGAALASLVAHLYALFLYALGFSKGRHTLRPTWSPRLDPAVLKRCLSIGVPSGITYFLIAINMLIIYRIISAYGTSALASVGIGYRILQTTYLPAFALTSAMGAVVGQNYGAGHLERIHGTLRTGWLTSGVLMAAGTGLCRLVPERLLGLFTDDPEVLRYGVAYLSVLSLGNVIVGTIMAVSSVFQGIGKTYPTFVAAVVDNALFALLGFTLPGIMGWGIDAVWWIKLSTAAVEMLVVGTWLRRELVRLRVTAVRE
ncbi:MAG: MATE family efflux transporter [Deltaproteobacteria bacterium]|nr:MATE family efflux transporter [Deltaproteobacteria bacterium]